MKARLEGIFQLLALWIRELRVVMKKGLAWTPSLSNSSNRVVKDFNNLWTLTTNIFQGMAYNAPDLVELKHGIIVKHVFGRSCPIAKIV